MSNDKFWKSTQRGAHKDESAGATGSDRTRTQHEQLQKDGFSLKRRPYIKGLAVGSLLVTGTPRTATGTRTDHNGGPVILTGIDAEDGGIGGHGPIRIYVDVVESVLEQVTNDENGILVVGETAIDTPNEVTEFWDEIGNQVGETVTYTGGPNGIRQQEFDSFAMVSVVSAEGAMGGPSPSGGVAEAEGLTDLENEALIDRSEDIAAFVNGGGGLVGSSQGYIDPPELTTPWGYIGELGDFETEVGLSYEQIEPTDSGSEVGITTDLNVCCWHDVFHTFPDFLDVLAVHDDDDEPQYGEPAALGGTLVLPDISLEIDGKTVVELDATEEYDIHVTNAGDEITENVFFGVEITHQDELERGDVTLEYYDEEWLDLEMDVDDGRLSGSLWSDDGISLPEDTEETIQLRLSFDTVNECVLSATVVGIDSEDVYATAEHRIREPAAQFTYDPDNPIVDEPVEFDASESDALDAEIEYFLWDVTEDDETDHEGEIVEHTFEEDGVYEVELTVIDSEGGDDITAETVPVALPEVTEEEIEDLELLRKEKLELASRIDEVSVSELGEYGAVEDSLNELFDAVEGEMVSAREAEDCLLRMIDGERHSKLVLENIGPAESQRLDPGYNLAGDTARIGLSVLTQMKLAMLSITNAAKHLPVVGPWIDQAESQIEAAMEWISGDLLSGSEELIEFAKESSDSVADAIIQRVAGQVDDAAQISEELDSRIETPAERVRDWLLEYVETGDIGGRVVPISEPLERLVTETHVDQVREEGLAGSPSGVEDAYTEGNAAVEDIFETAESHMEFLEDWAGTIDLVELVDEIHGVDRRETGTGLWLLQLVSDLVTGPVRSLIQAVISALGANVGAFALDELRRIHATTMDGIIYGNPQ